MATVHSLVCFGGRTGLTVTMTIANPCVVSLATHGLIDGTGVVFSTTGALPTGITSGTTYYSRSTAAGTFNLYDTSAHAIAGGTTGRITTSGSQSGVHTIKSAFMLGLTSTQLARYGTSGSERMYGGIQAWRAARVAAVPGIYDTEVCEIGEAFIDTTTAVVTIDLVCAAVTIETRVNGVRSSGYHGGNVASGYQLYVNFHYNNGIYIATASTTVDGIRLFINGHNNNGIFTYYYSYLTAIRNNIITMNAGEYACYGIYIATQFYAKVYNNLVYGIVGPAGIYQHSYSGAASVFYNNTATKCTVGFTGGTSECKGSFYNNISVGNTTNWGTAPNQMEKAAYNCGISGNTPWNVGAATAITTLTTSHFSDYTNNNFRPASSSAPQVDSALSVYQGDTKDIADHTRPNYVAATHPNEVWDCGCYEFDHGEGEEPAVVPISISGIVDGSMLAIYKTSDNSAIVSPTTISGGAYSGTYTYTSDVSIRVDIRKGTSPVKYDPYQSPGTITAAGLSMVVSQVPSGVLNA